MHKLLKPAFITVCLLSISLLFFHSTFATDSSHVTETVFFGNVKDDGSACGVFTILNTVVDIMSIGIGILAIIGITIVGIKYLTAGGNEEQTRKAKHRMLQIVIGLVVYAALYAGIQFLLPGGKLDFSYRCATISDEELAEIKTVEKEAQRKKSEAEAAKTKESSYNAKPREDTNKPETGVAEKRKMMLKAAKDTAAIFGSKKFVYSDYPAVSWYEVSKGEHTANCASYAILAAIKAGLIPDRKNTNQVSLWFNNYGRKAHIGKKTKKDLKENFQLIKGNSTMSKLIKSGKLAPGDIIGSGESRAHTAIYAGKKDNKCLLYEVTNRGRQYKNKILNNKHSCSYKVGYIVHIK